MAFEIKTRTIKGPNRPDGKATTEARYDVRYRTPAGKIQTKTFKKKKDAETFQRLTEADVITGDWTDPRLGKITFAEWWAQWWPTTVNLRPSTRARDESYYRNHLLPAFGATPIAAIDHTAVTVWVAKMSASHLAPATVVKAEQILGKTMGAAVDAGLIRNDPTARVKLPKIEHHEMRFLTPTEVATLAETIDARYRAMVLTAAYCGLRLGELAGLKRARVDLLHRRIEVLEIATEVNGRQYTGPPKTRAGRRSVPVPRIVADALEAHLAAVSGEYVFPAPEGGLMRPSLFRRRFWTPATVATGLGTVTKNPTTGADHYEGLRIHDLRHTAVALWIAAGASPKEIAARAGHSSVVTVLDRYGHLLPGHEDKVNDALDAMADAVIPATSGSVRAIDAR